MYINQHKHNTILEAVKHWTSRWPTYIPWNEADALYLVQDGRILWEIPVPEEVLEELYGKS